MWRLAVLITLSLFKLVVTYSVSINTSNLFCEIHLEDGCYEDFEAILPQFHVCIPPYSNNEFRLVLQNYSIPAFPNGSFSNLGLIHTFKLKVEGDSDVSLLVPNLSDFSLFTNSWFHSVIIYVSDLSVLMGWRWAALANLSVSLSGGFEFTAVRSKLLYLHSDFGKVARTRVTVVRILKCQLRWLGKDVFAPLNYLKTLELRDNLLENIERSHFPLFAPELRTLDLGNNRLTTLPLGFVDGLKLESIYLRGNNIKITETQAQTILSTRSFPLLIGVLWPCLCEEFPEKFENYSEVQNCYEENSANKVLGIRRFINNN